MRYKTIILIDEDIELARGRFKLPPYKRSRKKRSTKSKRLLRNFSESLKISYLSLKAAVISHSVIHKL
ncbi:hypothetical protein BH10BAC5_BH10BAC5_00040 [soil metagenome]